MHNVRSSCYAPNPRTSHIDNTDGSCLYSPHPAPYLLTHLDGTTNLSFGYYSFAAFEKFCLSLSDVHMNVHTHTHTYVPT